MVAAYVLSELPTEAERRGVVDQLWAHSSDVIVLVEPGTPTGSANIRQARAQVFTCLTLQQQQRARQPSCATQCRCLLLCQAAPAPNLSTTSGAPASSKRPHAAS